MKPHHERGPQVGWRRTLILAGLALILAAVGWSIHRKETLLSEGRIVLLELAPVDPRSLMQGDYMVINYALANALLREHGRLGWRRGPRGDWLPQDGTTWLRLDHNGVGQRAEHDGPEGTGTAFPLRYRLRQDGLRIAGSAFFFQEGHAGHYASARYGELRVAPDGQAVLVGLRDAERQPIRPPPDGAPR